MLKLDQMKESLTMIKAYHIKFIDSGYPLQFDKATSFSLKKGRQADTFCNVQRSVSSLYFEIHCSNNTFFDEVEEQRNNEKD